MIAEDSWSRTAIVKMDGGNPNGRLIVDAMWNFSTRDELRRLLLNDVRTVFGQLRGENGSSASSRRAAADTGCWGGSTAVRRHGAIHRVHHVPRRGEDSKRRFMNHVLSSLLRYFDHGDGSSQQVRDIPDAFERSPRQIPKGVRGLYQQALDRVRSGR